MTTDPAQPWPCWPSADVERALAEAPEEFDAWDFTVAAYPGIGGARSGLQRYRMDEAGAVADQLVKAGRLEEFEDASGASMYRKRRENV